MARLIERPAGPLSAPGAWFASAPKVTLRQLVERESTVGAKLGLVVAWNMMGRPIPAHPLVNVRLEELEAQAEYARQARENLHEILP